jgi:multiple sugar transport system permease protein
MIAPITLAIPLYTVFRRIGWLDRYQALITVYIAAGVGWSTLIMRSHFQMIPGEIEDAAQIDGCSRLRTLVSVILPMVVPGLISVGLVIFLLSWGEFLFALLFTQSEASRTLPVVVTMFVGEFGVDYPTLASALLLSVLPPALVALFCSKYIVSGLTAGAVKI